MNYTIDFGEPSDKKHISNDANSGKKKSRSNQRLKLSTKSELEDEQKKGLEAKAAQSQPTQQVADRLDSRQTNNHPQTQGFLAKAYEDNENQKSKNTQVIRKKTSKYKFVLPTPITDKLPKVKKLPKLVLREKGDNKQVNLSAATVREAKQLALLLDMTVKEYIEASMEYFKNEIFDMK